MRKKRKLKIIQIASNKRIQLILIDYLIVIAGEGEFGVVHQCLNRLDGCIYAIKRSIKPVAGSVIE